MAMTSGSLVEGQAGGEGRRGASGDAVQGARSTGNRDRGRSAGPDGQAASGAACRLGGAPAAVRVGREGIAKRIPRRSPPTTQPTLRPTTITDPTPLVSGLRGQAHARSARPRRIPP